MFRLLFLFILLAAASYSINWLNENPGELSFTWLGYYIETSFTFAVIALIAILIILSFSYQIIAGIFGVPTYFKRRARKKATEKSLVNISESYAALLSGDIDQARKHTDKLKKIDADNKDIKKISKILDAKISQEEGDLMIANHVYNELLEDKSNEYFATKGLLDSAFKSGNLEESIKLAEKAYELKPNINNGAHSLLELYKKTGNWDKAEKFLYKYKLKHSLFSDKHNKIDVKKEQAAIWFNMAKKHEPSEKQKPAFNEIAYNYIEKALKNDPYDEEILIEFIKVARLMKKDKKARSSVTNYWKKKQSFEVLQNYINSIKEKSDKDTVKKRMKALDQLESISKDESIELVRNSLITPEVE